MHSPHPQSCVTSSHAHAIVSDHLSDHLSGYAKVLKMLEAGQLQCKASRGFRVSEHTLLGMFMNLIQVKVVIFQLLWVHWLHRFQICM